MKKVDRKPKKQKGLMKDKPKLKNKNNIWMLFFS